MLIAVPALRCRDQFTSSQASKFEFSGRQYVSLDAVIKYCAEKGIMKNGERIPLTRVADW